MVESEVTGMAREGEIGDLRAAAGAASMSRSDDEGVSWDGRFSSAGDESSAPLASATEKTLRASSVERPKPALVSARRVHGDRMPALDPSAMPSEERTHKWNSTRSGAA